MFLGCRNLTTLDLSSFNTSNVTDMNGMFQYCESLTTLDLSNFDTSKVTNMSGMFYACKSLTTLDLSNFNTSKVTNMLDMSSFCNNLIMLHTPNKEIFKHCNARIKLVPKSSGIKYDKLLRNKKEVAKFLLLDFKGTLAYED
jgi:surface protein